MRLGPYANRANLTDSNGTLEINSVRASDATDYKCTVKRINFTSPETYFVTLRVDASGKFLVYALLTQQSPLFYVFVTVFSLDREQTTIGCEICISN